MLIVLRLVGYSQIYNNNKYVYDMYFTSLNKFNFNILCKLFIKLNNITNKEFDLCALNYGSLNLRRETLLNDKDNKILGKVISKITN